MSVFIYQSIYHPTLNIPLSIGSSPLVFSTSSLALFNSSNRTSHLLHLLNQDAFKCSQPRLCSAMFYPPDHNSPPKNNSGIIQYPLKLTSNAPKFTCKAFLHYKTRHIARFIIIHRLLFHEK